MIDPKNYIPGCESYTKASEISSLQKYLKKGIKKRDEALKVGSGTEDMPGTKDPRVPTVNELPGGSLPLRDQREVTELPDHSLRITNPNEPQLSEHREDIQSNEDPGNLPEGVIGLTDRREPSLEGHREDIIAPEVTELPGNRFDINDPRENSLVNHREDIIPNEVTSLENTKLVTPASQEGPESLDRTRLDLSDTRGVALENRRENIEGALAKEPGSLDKTRLDIGSNEDPGSLPGTIIGVTDDRQVSLEDHREDITDRRQPKLSKERLNLDQPKTPALDKTRLDIEAPKDPKLSGERLDLEDSRNPELSKEVIAGPELKETPLSKERLDLENSRNPELSRKRLDLEDSRSVDLDKTKVGLEDRRSAELDKTRLDLEDFRNPELSKKVVAGPELKETPLEKKRIDLTDKRSADLDGTVIELSDTRSTTLDSTRIDITDKRSTGLVNHREDLKDVQEIGSLPTQRLDIDADGPDKLSDTLVGLGVTDGVDGLPGEVLGITNDTQVSLGDQALKLTGAEGSPELPEGFEEVPGEVVDVSLPESSEGIPGEITDSVLPTERLDINHQGPDTLDDTRIDIQSPPDVTLPDGAEEINNPLEVTLPEGADRIPGEITEVGLKDEVIVRPAETPDIDSIYSETSGQVPDSITPVPVDALSDVRLDIEDPRENSLEDTRLDIDPSSGWFGELEDEQLKAPEGQEIPGWDGELETDVIKPGGESGWNDSLEDEQLKAPEGQESPGWNEALEDEVITRPEGQEDPGWNGELEDEVIKPTGESGWDESLEDTVISDDGDQNPTGWGGDLEDEQLKTPAHQEVPGWNGALEDEVLSPTGESGWDESLEDTVIDGPSPTNLTDINNVLGLFDTYRRDTERSQRLPSQITTEGDSTGQSYVDIDKDRRGNDTWPGDFTEDTAKAYGAKTAEPVKADPSQITGQTPNPWGTGTDQNFIDTREASDLQSYGADTETPEIRPGNEGDDFVDRTKEEDLKEYGSETSTAEKMPIQDSTRVPRYVDRQKDSDLSAYGADTESPEGMMPDQTGGDLGAAFNYSKENMGRSGWHVDDLAIPAYKLGGSFTSFLNPSKYLRFLVDKTVGAIPLKGSLKQWILDEALAGLITARDLLEESLNIEPHRLPGSNEYAIHLLRQSMSGVDLGDAKNFVGNVAANLLNKESIIIKNPINRPDWDKKKKKPKPQENFESKDGQNAADSYPIADTGSDVSKSVAKKIVEKVTKALGSNQGLADYVPSYFRDTGVENITDKDFGMIGTLKNLTKWSPTKIESFDELKTSLEQSPYFTTSSKIYGFRSGEVHRHDNVMTLDSNHVWEIVFEPYLGPENGEYSFLPSIQQINYENFYGFGINTNWDTWIPFTSFELNSKKMIQKSINLYSGEISIPQNLEFTNELRLVICDDQYKSWKRYFNMVMDASTYLCDSHLKGYYKKKKLKDISGSIDTFEDSDVANYYKGVVRPAPYKNLTFRCKILSMNPQLQTVNMSNLLVVLKDFTEEWQGEIDSSPTELALMFSVVGENPSAETELEKDNERAKQNHEFTEALKNFDYTQVLRGKVIQQ